MKEIKNIDLGRIQRIGRKTGLAIQLQEMMLIEKEEYMSEPQNKKFLKGF